MKAVADHVAVAMVRMQTERSLRRTVSELERSNRELEQFAYISAHDLQEPLRQVRSYVQLVRERYGEKFDGKGAQCMGFIYEGADRMSALVTGLLAYSQIGGRNRKREKVAGESALITAMGELKALIDQTGAHITYDRLPTLHADNMQLVQLFENLVGNAIKFRRDGISPEIHIGCRQDSGNWLFWIKDNGIGIDPQHHEKVFLIFQRLHGLGKYAGTGIGLAICRKIVEQHGGRMWLESKAGEGATFYFTLQEDLM
jgi:light-regulated signal transduction histidine kinase (bacteriophytochrome)